MQSFIDVLKDSLAQSGLIQELSAPYIVVSMSVALLCALLIYLVYRVFYRGACYSENFGMLIVVSTLATAFIIMTISSNIVMSLGMVGALSIVRFRSAVKDPLDVGFLFWSIAAGLTAGAGIYLFAVIGSLFIAIVYILMTLLKGRNGTYLLVVSYSDEAAQEVTATLGQVKTRLKNKTKRAGETELTVQLRLKPQMSTLVDSLTAIAGVKSAIMVEFTNE